eukprot:CAMPEP_0115207556 /NCGR_PEP_ID=MMETSP0270-20121206/20776_1 /TAXON_ID=71861 /ORGANISM="Scrippsiella trochoidea, Strain CCMP3099" /LENGTH=139 /DNA_ID=CAMNT_0002621151 /DNA_START=142 /DNA_END=561 /DNA_ORIENTATION=+
MTLSCPTSHRCKELDAAVCTGCVVRSKPRQILGGPSPSRVSSSAPSGPCAPQDRTCGRTCNLHPGDNPGRGPQSRRACRAPCGDPLSRLTDSPARPTRAALQLLPTTPRPQVMQAPPARTTPAQTSPSGARGPGGQLTA